MALVLRKAVLQQKNMSLLKFYKGRSVTYNNLGVSYRKNRTYLLLSPCEVSVQSYRDIGDVRDKIGGIPSKIPISPTPDKDSLVTAGSDWAIPPGSSAKLSKATGCENSSSQAATSDASASAQACSCSQLPNHSVTPSCNIQLPVYNYGQPPLCNHGQAPKCNCTKPNCSCSHTSFCNCAKPSFCSCTKPISYGQPPVGYGQTCCIQNHCNCSQTSHSQLQCGCSAHTPRGDVTVDVGKNCGCNSHAVNHKPVITYSSTCGYIGSTCPCATCGPMASSAPCPPCEPYQPSHYPCGHPCSPSGACTPGAWGPGGPSPCPTCPCPCPSPCPPRPQKKCVPCPECASRLAAAAISTATMAATAVAATAVPAVDRTPASAAPPSSNIKLGHNKKSKVTPSAKITKTLKNL